MIKKLTFCIYKKKMYVKNWLNAKLIILYKDYIWTVVIINMYDT